MTSVLRYYNRRDNTTTTVIPDLSGNITIDPRHCKIFTLDMATAVPRTGETVEYVNNSGQVITATNQKVYHFYLFVNINTARYYPGLEFKLFFNNLPDDPDAWISLDNCAIMSPPLALFNYRSVSITATSDGSVFNVTATGPQAWAYGPFF